ncbi:MAG: hypothetical protein V3U98_10750 [Acidobacteriota bacterium]
MINCGKRLIGLMVLCPALLIFLPAGASERRAVQETVGGGASGVPTEARLFRLRFKPVIQAVSLIEPLLSEDGTLLLEPKRRAITVHDRPEHLDRVRAMLEAWDTPPLNVRLVLQLIRARAIQGGKVRLSQELRGIGEALKDVTRWTDYEIVGSVSVTASEGGSVTLDVDEYRIQIILDQVAEGHGSVRLKRFTLHRREPQADGSRRLRPIWDTVLNLKLGQLTVLGATRLEQSQKAILLTMSATLEE